MKEEDFLIKEPEPQSLEELTNMVIALQKRIESIEMNEIRHLELKMEEIADRVTRLSYMLVPRLGKPDRTLKTLMVFFAVGVLASGTYAILKLVGCNPELSLIPFIVMMIGFLFTITMKVSRLQGKLENE